MRKRGYELVIDYKKNNLGLQSQFEDLILVDGNWYVTWMPQDLIDATKNYQTRLIDPNDKKKTVRQLPKKTYKSYLAVREAYRMKPKGKPDKDGYQRFIYPTPGTYMAIDRATGKRVAKPATSTTITIPIDAGSTVANDGTRRMALKYVQKFAYQSGDHRKHYGMRSLVESANKSLKAKNYEDLGNVSKRSGRGFAFNYLAATLAAVSANLRKIRDFFVKEFQREAGGKLVRERRRKEATGTPLAKPSSLPALAPPR